MTAPFGIELNRPLTPDAKIGDLSAGKCEITPPTPHPSFATYYAQESRNFGVVWLKGIGPEIANDAYGLSVQAQLVRLSNQLQGKYGKPRVADQLSYGSIWNESRDWVASIHQNERSFFHIWEAGKHQLPNDITTIFLGLVTYSHDDSALIIEYASTFNKQAESEQDDDFANLL